MSDIDYQQLHDELIEQLQRNIPQEWEASEGSAESIVVDYVHEIERRLIALGGSLDRHPERKPRWSTALLAVLEIERQAEAMRTVALKMRCGVEDSGGARCTADAYPEHKHRHRREELPR